MKLTDKRFWIFDSLVTISSIILGIKIWGCDIELITTFTIVGLLSGFIGFRFGINSVLRTFFATWLSYNVILTGGLLCLSISKQAAIQGYILLFGLILLIASFIPFLIISWIFYRICGSKH